MSITRLILLLRFTSPRDCRKPWVVLVTGVNGIRKTTSVYQSWFKEALFAALQNSGVEGDGDIADIASADDLPAGSDSFFRQLDYMIATVANEEFKSLYLTQKEVEGYSELKDAIFMRYRTLAEMLGVLLVKASIAKSINVMVETSGRDIAMFDYVDQFFPSDKYRKLVVHFTINDIEYAERSVSMLRYFTQL
jgi:hypothetical protein